MGISMDISMDIPMDIHEKICGYGCGYGWEISYPRQPWLWSYLAPFPIWRLTGWKLHIFATPLSFGALAPICSLWNFALKVTVRKLKSWGYSQRSLRRPHDRSLSILTCDGQTESIVAYTALCIADAL